MRLSTAPDRDDERGIAVIRAALDAGATVLDTADSYALDDRDIGHNERLIARALSGWNGDRLRVTVATKGGMRRPGGAWVADGRAKHLRDACNASCRALGVNTIDLYQLHAVDPKTPIETSVRALARLRDDGRIRDIGLCNVTVSQIRAAQAIAAIASVQVSLSPLDDEYLRNGVAEYCRDNGIRLLAHRPLGGDRVKQLARDTTLTRIAATHGVSNAEVALAWLLSFGGGVVPLPGATSVEHAGSLSRVLNASFGVDERAALDARFSGRLLRVPRAQRRPRDDAGGDVVIVMGMPGAGKSVLARALETSGYARLNRDAVGGSLANLARRLDDALGGGPRRVVLDNTYPTRKARNEVLETAWERGVPVRCIWLATTVADAQINAIRRMIETHGSLPSPEEIRERGRKDTRYLLPDAQFRYERTLEPPTADEGFASLEKREFAREPEHAARRALLLDFDDLVGGDPPILRAAGVNVDAARRELLDRHRKDGWLLLVHAWRPQIARGEITTTEMDACFAALRDLVGEVDVATCPHDAGPPTCWCRKPLPGSPIEFAMRRGVSLERSVVVGSSAADRTMATRVGGRFEPFAPFFAKGA
jgi:aryl-alcohol dehydrogenase-like predicted oxidoreductase/histidinol phosphatase-like enzyme